MNFLLARFSALAPTVFLALGSTAAVAGNLADFASVTPLSAHSYVVKSDAGQLIRVTAYGDRRVRVQVAASGAAFAPDNRYAMVERHDWPGSLTLIETADDLTFSTTPSTADAAGVQVRFTKFPLRLSFTDPVSGARLFEKQKGGIDPGKPAIAFEPPVDDEHFAGLGHGTFGRVQSLDLRGQSIERNFDSQSPLLVPFFMSSRGYGLFFNSTWKNKFNFKDKDYSVSFKGGQLDFFFIGGPGFDAILDQYTQLIGRPRLLPIYALGLMLSDKQAIGSGGEETTAAWWQDKVQQMRAGGWTFDVIVHDNSWRGGKTAPWRWKLDNYPSPDGFEAWSKQNNVVSLLDFNASDAKESAGWQSSFGLPGDSSHPDFSNPATRAWFWHLLSSETFDPKLKFPGDLLWLDEFDDASPSGTLASGRSWDEEANNYFFLRDQAVGEGWIRDVGTTKRPFMMNRGMTGGSQRFGASMWSGDIQSSYDEMKLQIRGMLQAGLSGVPYWGSDQGGFKSKPDDDLYRRSSIALGSFSPLWKPHGMKLRFPWLFSTEAQNEMRRFGELRMSLIPYLYSYAAISAETGAPMARAMIFRYPREAAAWSADQQFLLGDELLVGSVTGANASSTIWLPAGRWFDFATDRVLEGNQTFTADYPLGQLPVFVRAGSIIPRVSPALSTAQLSKTLITLHVYPGQDAHFRLYEDDGTTDQYRQGASQVSAFHWSEADATLRADRVQGTYPGAPLERNFQIVLHGAKALSRVFVERDGKKTELLTSTWNSATHQQFVSLFLMPENSREFKLTFVP